LQVVFSCV